MDYIRTLVSGNKNRYVDSNYNLDLTYITSRIIGMAFPGSGIQTLYRNNINTVATFLFEKHKNDFLIVNLSGYSYDKTKFENNVVDYHEWLDHHSPPINLLFTLCQTINNFLSKNNRNVIVINCNAGKGRTGTLICCYLLFSGRFTKLQDALDYYSLKRLKVGKGVTNPSQIRYVRYFDELLKHKKYYFPYRRKLTQILISIVPYDYMTSIAPYYKINDSKLNKKLHSNEGKITELIFLPNSKNPIEFSEKGLSLNIYGDIMIHLSHKQIIKNLKVGRLAFNTAFIGKDDSEYIFNKHDIDPYSFSSNSKVNPNYKIILKLKKLCECDNTKDQSYLCNDCKTILKSELKDWEDMNKIISSVTNDFEKGTVLLFGSKEEDDVDKTLALSHKLTNLYSNK